MQESEESVPDLNDNNSVADLLLDSTDPRIKEFLSEYILIGYSVDKGRKVVVSQCPDKVRRVEFTPILNGIEQWGKTKLY